MTEQDPTAIEPEAQEEGSDFRLSEDVRKRMATEAERAEVEGGRRRAAEEEAELESEPD